MAANPQKPTVIVIAGPTASGKSALALDLAQKIGGEIICADSRTIYKDLTIGVAKPTKLDRQKVVHHCLDLVNLGEKFNASDFKEVATSALNSIQKKGAIAIIVGGSGLYIDGLVYDFGFLEPAEPSERSKLNNKTINELKQMIISQKLAMPSNHQNKRHLIRALETAGKTPRKKPKPDDVIYTAINPSKLELTTQITKRVDKMYELGFELELKKLLEKYPQGTVKSAGIGYSAGVDYIQGKISLDQAKQAFTRGDIALAKRQLTWLKRNPDVEWFSSPEQLKIHILRLLSK